MDYSKSGSAATGKKSPRRHVEHNSKGTRKNPFGDGEAEQDPKSALLARMKAAAEARKKP